MQRIIQTAKKSKSLTRLSGALHGAILVLLLTGASLPGRAIAATCVAPATNYGSVSSSVSIPAAATYRVWSHMEAANASNSTYYLNIDNTNCFNVGGSGVGNTGWSWVDYQDGSSASKVDVSLSQGTHALTFIGDAPGVNLDHVVFTSDLACVPVGAGDNCNTPSDTTVPTVKITAPSPGSTLSGSKQIAVTASDNVGVTKVELYINNVLRTALAASPYTYTLDTSTLANGPQTIIVKAYDAAGNFASDNIGITVQNTSGGPVSVPPATPSGFTATAAAYNKVVLHWNAPAGTNPKGYTITRNSSPLVIINSPATLTYEDDTVLPGTRYTYGLTATGTDGSSSAAATASVTTPTIADTQAPTKPANLAARAVSASQINLTWQASTDNIGVAGYDVYRATGTDSAAKVATVTTASYGDTNLTGGTRYTYYVVAKDSAGNVSAASASVSVTTSAPQRSGVLEGTVTDKGTKKPLANATVVLNGAGTKTIYHTDAKGHYTISALAAGRYEVTYRARSYQPKSRTLRISTTAVIQNVQLNGRQ